jgi:hypothetical protein
LDGETNEDLDKDRNDQGYGNVDCGDPEHNPHVLKDVGDQPPVEGRNGCFGHEQSNVEEET